MKTCFKCGAAKPLAEFYAHARMADGHLNKCKACTRADTRRNRGVRREHYLAYDRARVGRTHARQSHPAHNRARVHVSNAVRRGKLTRQPCEACGVTQTEAHHDDYTKPLAVRWLCRAHHAELHRIDSPARGVERSA